MKKRILIFIFIVLIPVIAIWLIQSSMTSDVEAVVAQKGKAVDAVTGTVEVFANIDLKVETETDGRLVSIPVELGQQVKAGDVLAEIESEEIKQQLKQKIVMLEAAKKRLALPYSREFDVANVENDIARLSQLVGGGAASRSELEKRQRDLEAAKGWLEEEHINRKERVDVLETEVAVLQNRLKYCQIVAPNDGEVAEVLIFPGDFIYRGNQILRLISPGRWVQMTLSEEDSYGVEIGQKATVYPTSYPNQRFDAEVTGKASFADSGAKTRNVFLHMDLPDDQLIPGLTGQAVLVKEEREGNVVIPRRGLIGNLVYVVHKGRVEVRKVKVGFRSLDKAEILEGISDGDLVIVNDQSLLHEGDKVIAEIEK